MNGVPYSMIPPPGIPTQQQQQQQVYGQQAYGYPMAAQPQQQQQPPVNPAIGSNTNSKDPEMVRARIFVGNLNTHQLTKQEVYDRFALCGKVIGLTVFKGYAFVQYASPAEAEIAVRMMHGFMWSGSELDVRPAFSEPPPKKSRPAPAPQPSHSLAAVAPPQATSTPGSQSRTVASQVPTPCEIFTRNRQYASILVGDSGIPEFPENVGGDDDVLFCGECHLRISDPSAFIIHKKEQCTFVRPLPVEPELIACFTCDNKFTSAFQLVQHLVSAHNLNLYRPSNDEDYDNSTENSDIQGKNEPGPRTPPESPPEDQPQATGSPTVAVAANDEEDESPQSPTNSPAEDEVTAEAPTEPEASIKGDDDVGDAGVGIGSPNAPVDADEGEVVD